jgi:hypothetical protein
MGGDLMAEAFTRVRPVDLSSNQILRVLVVRSS